MKAAHLNPNVFIPVAKAKIVLAVPFARLFKVTIHYIIEKYEDI